MTDDHFDARSFAHETLARFGGVVRVDGDELWTEISANGPDGVVRLIASVKMRGEDASIVSVAAIPATAMRLLVPPPGSGFRRVGSRLAKKTSDFGLEFNALGESLSMLQVARDRIEGDRTLFGEIINCIDRRLTPLGASPSNEYAATLGDDPKHRNITWRAPSRIVALHLLLGQIDGLAHLQINLHLFGRGDLGYCSPPFALGDLIEGELTPFPYRPWTLKLDLIDHSWRAALDVALDKAVELFADDGGDSAKVA